GTLQTPEPPREPIRSPSRAHPGRSWKQAVVYAYRELVRLRLNENRGSLDFAPPARCGRCGDGKVAHREPLSHSSPKKGLNGAPSICVRERSTAGPRSTSPRAGSRLPPEFLCRNATSLLLGEPAR